jgi:uncharacterized protein (TIGR03083 family)
MQVEPQYDGPAILRVPGDGSEVGAALVRQRRRLQATLASLGDDDWQVQSRCEAWSVQDVAVHLDGVNRFWHWSIADGLAGTPTRLLENFDPKATPAAMVDAARATNPTPSETLAALGESSEALCEQVEQLDSEQWAAIAECPAGHLPMVEVAHHALWDCWVHERDVALPLGLDVAEEPDEVMACLRYVAAIGPALALRAGLGSPSTLVLETRGPDGCVVVEVRDGHTVVHDRPDPDAGPATLVLRDRAVDLVEILSARAPLAHPVPGEHRWLVQSLAIAFETSDV